MAENLLITQEELREFWPVSKNINAERINPFILRAQQRELKPFLGEALYFDFVTNITDANYVLLLDGEEYELNGHTIFFNGVKPLLASFAYSQFLRENPLHVTRAGNKNKTDEDSVEVDTVTTGIKSNEAKSEAVRLQDETLRYLTNKSAEFPLWGKGVNINEPTKTGFSITKVPRSIQR